MHRLVCRERPNWKELAENLGFSFHSPDGLPYWDESACYQFTLEQIEEHLEAPTQELHAMALGLVEDAVRDEQLLERLAIPRAHWDYLRSSWQRRDSAMYGRMDLSYDGRGPAKLYELNYDTPTSLYESAFFQWVWLEQLRAAGELPGDVDQFNSIQDKLEAYFARVGGTRIHFTSTTGSDEDWGTVAYLCDIARQAGCDGHLLPIEQIGLTADQQFVDDNDEPIQTLFKLYPWEDLLNQPYAEYLRHSTTVFLEPVWKLILSNKAAMALLWERHPGHPNLLPTYVDQRDTPLPPGWVRKPFFSREGANIEIAQRDGSLLRVDGPYAHQPVVRQALQPLPRFGEYHPVVGSWIVGDAAAGLGIREDDSLITQNRSRFVPHIILD